MLVSIAKNMTTLQKNALSSKSCKPLALKQARISKKPYKNLLRSTMQWGSMDNDVRISSLSRYPDVFTMEEADANDEEIWKELNKCGTGACENFVQSRIAE